EDELVKIKRLPPAEKKEALAACRVFVEKSIEINHETPKEELMELVSIFAERYGFTEDQAKTAENLIDQYYENRKRVLEVRQQFPDDRDLASRLTGFNFGEVENVSASVGPMGIEIETDERVVSQVFAGLHKKGQVSDFIAGGFASSAILAQKDGAVEIPYIFIANYPSEVLRLPGKSIRRHEREHVKNRLFELTFGHIAERDLTRQLPREGIKIADQETKKFLLENYLLGKRLCALESTKDEILAKLQSMTLKELSDQLPDLFFSKGGGPYDYLSEIREDEELADDPMWRELVNKILVSEYEGIVSNAMWSFIELVKTGGYSVEEAIALLTDKPLSEWQKTLWRLRERSGGRKK
ncbi:MAG: hypothetical protein AAB495_01000, partial [Patescibacteria group bacterium]